MEQLPQNELETLIDEMFIRTDKLAFEALNKILEKIRAEAKIESEL